MKIENFAKRTEIKIYSEAKPDSPMKKHIFRTRKPIWYRFCICLSFIIYSVIAHSKITQCSRCDRFFILIYELCICPLMCARVASDVCGTHTGDKWTVGRMRYRDTEKKQIYISRFARALCYFKQIRFANETSVGAMMSQNNHVQFQCQFVFFYVERNCNNHLYVQESTMCVCVFVFLKWPIHKNEFSKLNSN